MTTGDILNFVCVAGRIQMGREMKNIEFLDFTNSRIDALRNVMGEFAALLKNLDLGPGACETLDGICEKLHDDLKAAEVFRMARARHDLSADTMAAKFSEMETMAAGLPSCFPKDGESNQAGEG